VTALLATLLVLMIVPEGFDYQRLVDEHSPAAGGVGSRLLWLLLLGLSAILVVRRRRLAMELLRQLNPYLVLLFALAVLSVIWSIDPALSLRRVLRMCSILLVCVAFVLYGWQASRFQQVLRPVLTCLLVGSLAFGLVFPALAIHQGTSAEVVGAWRGLTNHKNSLGDLAGLGAILWFHAGLTRQCGPARALAGGAVACTCLLLSRSSTSLLAMLAVCGVLSVLLRARPALQPYLPHLLTVLVGSLLLAALALLQIVPGINTLLAPVTAMTDKNTTLTGRSDVWNIVLEHSANHPVLGTGYGAYWTPGPVPGTDAFEFLRRMQGFFPGSAHNGYLDIVNDLGWMGLALLIAYVLSYLVQAAGQLRLDSRQASLYLAVLLHQLITNLSESHWFSVRSVDFAILALATTGLARSALDARHRQLHGEPSVAPAASTGLQARALYP
jgi:O-antigen ligase